jgi:hypothetical protein
MAAALYLFLRDVCGGDFISWIDDHLSRPKEPNAASIVDASRHIHGVSDKNMDASNYIANSGRF